jgi:alpha-amylase
LARREVTKKDLFDIYFDHGLNRHVFDRAAKKCYFPANSLILDGIDKCKRGYKQFKVAYSLSGVFVEQCERWNPDLLESFRQLADSGCVEFLEQTYYHSLASLFGTDRSEFVEQVQMHCQLMKDLFNYEPRVIENTECLYNNAIARTVEGLGYEAMCSEGTERILEWRSPNYVYKAKGSNIRLLLRNYRISDDIGFRFNARWWEEWPLTADKYASWLAASPGQVINIFIDYETLGEHYPPDSGIHEFLKWLPLEVVKWDNLSWRTPSEVIRRHNPVGELDVHEYNTISWADIERDTSAWIGNRMQMTAYNIVRGLEPLVKEVQDEDLTRLWRYLQMSDHFYYMSTKGAGPGDVHAYFSPYWGGPVEAFAVYLGVLSDLEARLIQELKKPNLAAKRMLMPVPAEKSFIFYYGFARPSGRVASSLNEFYSTLKVIGSESIRFHMERGDFERWIRQVIGDDKLADKLAEISGKKLTTRALVEKVLSTVESRIKELGDIASKPLEANA